MLALGLVFEVAATLKLERSFAVGEKAPSLLSAVELDRRRRALLRAVGAHKESKLARLAALVRFVDAAAQEVCRRPRALAVVMREILLEFGRAGEFTEAAEAFNKAWLGLVFSPEAPIPEPFQRALHDLFGRYIPSGRIRKGQKRDGKLTAAGIVFEFNRLCGEPLGALTGTALDDAVRKQSGANKRRVKKKAPRTNKHQ